MSRRSRGGNLTIRQGTGEKYWYTQVGFIFASILAIGYMVVAFDSIINATTTGGAMAASLTLGLVMFGLVIYGLVTYGALFRDNAYVRGQYRGWNPRWWYYIGAGFGIPVAVFAVARLLGEGETGGGLAMMVFVISTLGMNVAWIYNRHRYIGIP